MSRRLAPTLDHRAGRRIVIVPLVIIAAIAAVVLSPLLIIGAALVDLARGRRDWPRCRIVFLVIGALVIEVFGMAVALLTWIATGFGLAGSQRWRWQLNRVLMGWYARLLLRLITTVLGTSIEWRDHADLSTGPVVLLARHTSFFDALIPAGVLARRRNRLLAHHVVAKGLRYAPCIDIVGHRFPNRFIGRAPGEGSGELGPIRDIGTVLDERSAAVIFPEGTFRNPERFERAIRRLRRRHPDRAERAKQLVHVLPPRPNGTFALLEGAPTADVVLCVNTGLESFGSLRAILDLPKAERPIVIETWRISRADIPSDIDGFDDWLFAQFVAVDDWVTRVR